MSDEKTTPKTVALTSRESVNAMQITNLLNMFTVTTSFLLNAQHSTDETPVGGPNDGGVRASVETTLMNLCARLDTMLAEPGRWDMNTQANLESNLNACYKQNTEMLAAQTAAYAEINSPHYRLKPAIIKLGPKEWLAFCGDATNLDNALVGMGDCPQKAIEAFDAIFKGEVPEHLKNFLAAREAAITKDNTVLEWDKFKSTQTETKNEIENLDTARPENTPKPTLKRGSRKSNRKDGGTLPQVGGAGGSPE